MASATSILPMDRVSKPINPKGQYSDSDLMRALSHYDKNEILGGLEFVSRAGEAYAAAMNYGDTVARLMGNADPEVASSALVALGGMGNVSAKYLQYIEPMLSNNNSLLRGGAAECLGRLGSVAVGSVSKLQGNLANDPDPSVRVISVKALGLIGDLGAMHSVQQALNDPSPEVSAAACEALARLGGGSETDFRDKLTHSRTRVPALKGLTHLGDDAPEGLATDVVECLEDADIVTRQEALACVKVMAQAILDSSDALDKLKDLLTNDAIGVKCAAAVAIGALGSEASRLAEPVAELLSDDAEDESGLALLIGNGGRRPAPALRRPKCAALHALAALDSTSSLSTMAGALNDSHWEVRAAALEAIGQLGTNAINQMGACSDLLDDDSFAVRAAACAALGAMQADEVLGRLVEKFEDRSYSVRAASIRAVGAIGVAAQDFCHEIFKMLDDSVGHVRAAAVYALSMLGENARNYVGVIGNLLEDADAEVRVEVLGALGRMGEHGAAFAMEAAPWLNDPVAEVRVAAYKSLVAMGKAGSPFIDEEVLANDPAIAAVLKSGRKAMPAPTSTPEIPIPFAAQKVAPSTASQALALEGLGAMYGLLGKKK